MNPDTTVFIPVPVSEIPDDTSKRYSVIGKIGNAGTLSTATYTPSKGWRKDGSQSPFPDHFTHWLKPVKLSEITYSQPVKTNEDIALEETREALSELIRSMGRWINGNGAHKDFDLKRWVKAKETLAKYYNDDGAKIVQSSIYKKPNEDILVKALKEIQQMSDAGDYVKAIVDMKKIATEALSSYRTSSGGEEQEQVKITGIGYSHTNEHGEWYLFSLPVGQRLNPEVYHKLAIIYK